MTSRNTSSGAALAAEGTVELLFGTTPRHAVLRMHPACTAADVPLNKPLLRIVNRVTTALTIKQGEMPQAGPFLW